MEHIENASSADFNYPSSSNDIPNPAHPNEQLFLNSQTFSNVAFASSQDFLLTYVYPSLKYALKAWFTDGFCFNINKKTSSH